MVAVAWTTGLLLKTVLQLQLGMRRKTITGRDVDPPEVLAPAHRCSAADIDLAEKLLVPAERAEKLGSEFVLRF